MASLASLRLTDFRSYDRLDLDLSPGPVVLFGANGAGKTNLMEAVSLLSPGRGLRGAGIDALARVEDGRTAPAWGINAALSDTTHISVGQLPDSPRRRIVRINRTNATAAQLADLLTVQWLTPAQDRLFTGPESDRRRFVDRLALAFDPSHGVASLRYEKARAERNRLLSDGVSDASWYDALEADMAACGAAIAKTRVDTVERMREAIAERDASAFPQAGIEIEGTVEDLLADGVYRDDAEVDFRERLAETRPIDRRAGRSLTGPHRTTIKVTHPGKAMDAVLCSTGEQKALLIGLILAHARAQVTRSPVLLLDEVAAHLDATRRAALSEELIDLGLQVFMTGTDRSLFTDFGDRAQWFEVADGRVEAVDPSAQ
ncbi:DNA replication/repair protein RecF [uncultured Algimonas sp.]|uniref:DNA replication/repair protein RecF n=1 Tax=uncultured Algimonas sp. TaxID=1547920 RepID=UPI0026097927|nr:DNA replication/repair protein RecF [uncultured Algimonas sp.]